MKEKKRDGAVIYLAWIAFQRRADSMKGYANFKLVYIAPILLARYLKPISYLFQIFATWAAITKANPRVIWFQAPPTFLTHCLLFFRLFCSSKFLIIADMHNSAFRAPWIRIPWLVSMLNRLDLVVVHNVEIKDFARTIGVNENILQVLTDPPASFSEETLAVSEVANQVIVPCSFAPDEPIGAVLRAAKLTPEYVYYITGDLLKARRLGYLKAKTRNVHFTDYLSRNKFDTLLCSSHIVLGLTDLEGVQLSVANEAIGACKPMVLSDTAILREMFGDAALFTSNSGNSIASSVRKAMINADDLRNRVKLLNTQRNFEWSGEYKIVMTKLIENRCW